MRSIPAPMASAQRAPEVACPKICPHPAMVWTPFVLAALGLVFQFSVGITELLRLGKEADTPNVMAAMRPALMQTLWLAIGAAAMGVCSVVRGRLWISTAWVWLTLGFLALTWLVLHLPGATTLNGSTRWLGVSIPPFGMITLQPSEFFKLSVLLWFAWVYGTQHVKGVTLGILQWIAGVILIVLQPDRDTAILVFLIGFGVMFMSGLSRRKVAMILLVAGVVAGLVTIAPFVLGAVRQQPWETQWGASTPRRIMATLNPHAYMDREGYQMIRARIAVGSGGLLGVGLGEGREKYHLPVAESDYIFAVIAEETGLAGSLLVVGLLGLFVWACFRSAERAPTRPARLFLAGLGVWVGIGALMNLSMAIGLLPTMGLPLPFVSAGGSALVSLMAAVGIAQALMKETP